MDKKQIVKQASQLNSKEDLLNLLNRIKIDEIEELGFDASKYHPFTMRHINYYCNPNNVFHRYRQFHIRKKIWWHKSNHCAKESQFYDDITSCK